MARTDGLTIGELGADAVAEAFPLAVEVGWNQTADDWVFCIAHGTVFGARDDSGRLIATAAVLPYAGNSARPAGLCLGEPGDRHRLAPRPRTGHADAPALHRDASQPFADRPARRHAGGREGLHPARVQTCPRVAALARRTRRRLRVARTRASAGRGAACARIAALDTLAFGAQRQTLLTNFRDATWDARLRTADGSGYALVRSGRVASYVGPVVAANARDAIALIDAATASTPGRIFIDVPDPQTQIAAWLGVHGFTVQRPLLRMALGPDLAARRSGAGVRHRRAGVRVTGSNTSPSAALRRLPLLATSGVPPNTPSPLAGEGGGEGDAERDCRRIQCC